MDIKSAVEALSALAQEGRLQIFRVLVERGEEGMPAGEIARLFDAPHNSMSSQLSILAQAGLVKSRRAGRSIIYSADLAGVRSLLSYLLEDCCGGRPEICAPVISNIARETAR